MVVLGTVFQFILEFSCLALNKSIIHDMSFRASNKSEEFLIQKLKNENKAYVANFLNENLHMK